jgi:hypothetical protein
MNTSTVSLKSIGVEPTVVSRHVPGLRDDFVAPGVDLVVVDYEGMLGSRVVRDVVLLTRKGKYVDFDLPVAARQEFRGLCEVLLGERFPEWWQAEGAEGRFLWDLSSDTLSHEHHLRTFPEFDGDERADEFQGDDGSPEFEIPF